MQGNDDIDDTDASHTYYFTDEDLGPLPWYKKPQFKASIATGATVAILAIGITVLLILLRTTPQLSHPESILVEKGAVAADSRRCSIMGLNILKEGGNAIDAAVTTAICLGVIQPFASGLGGGCVINIRMANGTEEVIDAREVAPAASNMNMFDDNYTLSKDGPLSIAIPGELKGLELAWQRYGSGRIPWARLFRDSISAARDGLAVNQLLSETMKVNGNTRDIISDEKQKYKNDIRKYNMKDIFAPRGPLLDQGEILQQPQLAETLQTIAEKGSSVFYEGEIARNMTRDLSELGASITLDDFKNYAPKITKPLYGSYRGYNISAAGPPFTGGPVILQTFNILEGFTDLPELWKKNDPMATHLTAEALKFGFANRVGLCDPSFPYPGLVDVIENMTSKAHGETLRKRISSEKAYESSWYQDVVDVQNPSRDAGTAHISVIDEERNAVALTSSINDAFGSFLVSPSTGVLFNNQMDDFSTPEHPEHNINIPPSAANYIAPGKRPISSMAPLIFHKDGKTRIIIGGGGGARCITSVMQVLNEILDGGQAMADALWRPRFHTQWIPDEIIIEPSYREYSEAVYQKLKEAGNKMVTEDPSTAVQAVVINEDNMIEAASDPRKLGVPAGY
ncbi:gamma-glutamyltranspeptidase 1-like [Planoprotostelium fungivorum]|uniref:Gamma-glutamyltranspeptidase 1-like n=1 Tax=Planoprotostelium fungivorum TaxID=1890364 RepID=A0A2P6NL42_9EUKA|nr:gamma-glutamyltranspeptidase 1-like [Planoprotostelium fungivorum]